MKPDALVTWPRHCDYPLWRAQLRKHRPHLGDVFVVFSDHQHPLDHRGFVADALAPLRVHCFDAPQEGDRDWRDAAVNAALDRASGEWVWFTEQDLHFRFDVGSFWSALAAAASRRCAFGWREQDYRWHPSCLVVRRAVVDHDTGRYFGPVPTDHFAAFGDQLDDVVKVENLADTWRFGGFTDEAAAITHMAGLSHNHRMLESRRFAEAYKPHELQAYLRDCLSLDVPLEPGWARVATEYLEWA